MIQSQSFRREMVNGKLVNTPIDKSPLEDALERILGPLSLEDQETVLKNVASGLIYDICTGGIR